MNNSMILEFNVSKQSLKRTDTFRPVANSKNYLYGHFVFDSDWSGLEKYAVFGYEDCNYITPIDENGMCKIMSDVIKAPRFKVCAKGYSQADELKITTNVENIGVSATSCGGEEPPIRNVVSKSLVVRKEGDTLYIELPNTMNEGGNV